MTQAAYLHQPCGWDADDDKQSPILWALCLSSFASLKCPCFPHRPSACLLWPRPLCSARGMFFWDFCFAFPFDWVISAGVEVSGAAAQDPMLLLYISIIKFIKLVRL